MYKFIIISVTKITLNQLEIIIIMILNLIILKVKMFK